LKAINDRKQDYVPRVLLKKKLRQMFIIEILCQTNFETMVSWDPMCINFINGPSYDI